METYPPNLVILLPGAFVPIMTLGNASKSASKKHAAGALATIMLGTATFFLESFGLFFWWLLASMTLGNAFNRASKNHAFGAAAGNMLSTETYLVDSLGFVWAFFFCRQAVLRLP